MIMIMELTSPVIFFLTERWRRRLVAFFLTFHVMTYAMITIIFLPHVLCLLTFLPLERLVRQRRAERPPPPTPEPLPRQMSPAAADSAGSASQG
jgi:hypothetical protein